MHLQLAREHSPLITIPDDPLDPDLWDDTFDQSNWSVVVKPITFGEAAQSGVVWGVVSSRWATYHDMAKILLEDSELSVVCTRYLPGDPLPWDGANLRYGTLVISIEDKSGVYIGTSNGGRWTDGLRRSVAEFAEDFIDSTANLIDDTEAPQEYFIPGLKLTKAEAPYVVYRTGEGSGIESSRFINSPAKAVQVNVGGHSMPGVNEAISATIQAIGDLWGNVVLIGGLGGSIDTLLKPLYEDTILAWWSLKSVQRAQNAGWSRYFEYFQDGCVAADTLIDGPDGKERIDVLAQHGNPFRVWSITPDGHRVAAIAEYAFRKGYAELFEYTLEDGRSIAVTHEHRFLTPAGFVQASDVQTGDRISVVDWTQEATTQKVRKVRDEDYVGINSPYQKVVQIRSCGSDYFYDMHVPGWENYSANGLWNHNSNKAYTIASLMVLRAGFWSTRTVIANEMKVLDASPYMVGGQGIGHYFLDDRIGFSLENDPSNQIWVDRARKIELKWDADSYPEWIPTIGDPRNLQDPAQRAWGRIEQMIAALRDLGAY